MITSTLSPLTKINAQKLNARTISKPRDFQLIATIAKAKAKTKAKTSTLDLEFTSLNLQELCLDVIAEIEKRFKSDISISFTFKGNYSNVYLDKRLIWEILINLLDNAVNYSQDPESKVDLSVIVKANVVNFIVQDQGIGIPVADEAFVFEPFYRGTNTDKIEGSGVGLTIVQRCVDFHKGQITFQSILGRGSEFTVSMPLVI